MDIENINGNKLLLYNSENIYEKLKSIMQKFLTGFEFIKKPSLYLRLFIESNLIYCPANTFLIKGFIFW